MNKAEIDSRKKIDYLIFDLITVTNDLEKYIEHFDQADLHMLFDSIKKINHLVIENEKYVFREKCVN